MQWHSFDTWTTLTAVTAAWTCVLPGLWLVLRRHSMMGDAIAHSALLGIVAAAMTVGAFQSLGWVDQAGAAAIYDAGLFVGATVVGVFTAFLTEWIGRVGRLEPGAALGVVFSSLFALGLLLIRLYGDDRHLDADCVLFGDLSSAMLDRVAGTRIPRALVTNVAALAINAAVTMLLFKELRIASFDPDHAAALGMRPRLIHYILLTLTSITVVAAFETVGSILVIALLVVPTATALLLARSLRAALVLSLVAAMLAGVFGHVAARTLPGIVFGGWGIRDAGTAGMVSVCAGLLFVLAWLFSPHSGLLPHWWRQLSTTIDVAAEDLLGGLYRLEERGLTPEQQMVRDVVARRFGTGDWLLRVAFGRLRNRGQVRLDGTQWRLTDPGRTAARKLIRAHRLWEAYLAKHFRLPPDHLHQSAMRTEHYIDPELAETIHQELDAPETDPHGRAIPTGDASPKPHRG